MKKVENHRRIVAHRRAYPRCRESFYNPFTLLKRLPFRFISTIGWKGTDLMPISTIASREHPSYADAHLQIDFDRQIVTVDSGAVELTAKEYALLAFLAEHAGEVLARESLLLSIWGYGGQIRTRTLDVHLARIRKKLGPFGRQYIETIFGLGCRFQPQRPCAVPEAAIANVA